MKKVLIIIPLFILIFAIAGYAAITGDCRISLIKGDVLIQTYDTASEWVAASINTPVTDGDKILWIIGMRIDNRFRISEQTKKILVIEKI